jgi:hypothetical protein
MRLFGREVLDAEAPVLQLCDSALRTLQLHAVAGHPHQVTRAQLAATPQFHCAIDLHRSGHDLLFGLAPAAGQAGGFEQGVKRDVVATKFENQGCVHVGLAAHENSRGELYNWICMGCSTGVLRELALVDPKKSKIVFTICTISNDLAQYQAMRDSFLAAGFDETRCDYRLLDNTLRNVHDPFEVLSSVSKEAAGHFVIVCHQDVRIDRGAGFAELLQRLNELSAVDPTWAVAGNYGVTPRQRGTGTVFDPNGTSQPGPFPQKVLSLDEDFLVIPSGIPVRCSSSMRGFHLYGTDICLNAAAVGRSSYVIDFPLSHLSGGKTAQEAFRQAVDKMIETWNARFVVAIVGTPNTTLRLSRWRPVRAMLRSTKVCRILVRFGLSFIAYPFAAESPLTTRSHDDATP